MAKKLYIIQKKVYAESVAEAIQKEKKTPIDSVYPDTSSNNNPSDAIGFKHVPAILTYEE